MDKFLGSVSHFTLNENKKNAPYFSNTLNIQALDFPHI